MMLDKTSGEGLKDGKLLIIDSWPQSEEHLNRIRKQYPGLEIVHLSLNTWGVPKTALPDVHWEDVVVLVTGDMFPPKERAKKLQLVQLMSAGVSFIMDNPVFKDTDIAFSSANGVHGPQISEWIISTFLAHQHHIPTYLDQMKEEKWNRHAEDYRIEDTPGLKVGILGYGAIGRQTARVATALGMEVYAYTNHPRPTPESRHDTGTYTVPGLGDPEGIYPSKWFSGSDPKSINEFLSSGLDLLVLSVPLTPKTKHIISAPQLRLLSAKRTFISNIGRGPLINTDDLVQALNEEWIRGAALDVTDPEPLPEGHPLWKAKNVIITPHVSWASKSYNSRVMDLLELNLRKVSQGKDVINKVSRKQGY